MEQVHHGKSRGMFLQEISGAAIRLQLERYLLFVSRRFYNCVVICCTCSIALVIAMLSLIRY